MALSCPRVENFTVAWISALPVELAAAKHILDELYEDPEDLDISTLCCVFGRIAHHNVVLACLPAGQLGIGSAAVVATKMDHIFPNFQLRLMVGIGGGVPSADVRLGDVVISQPQHTHGGVVQYDFGKSGVDGAFERTGALSAPPTILLNAVAKLQALMLTRTSNFRKHLALFTSMPDFTRENASLDQLFKPESKHVPGVPSCKHCDHSMIVGRATRRTSKPVIHYGTIASGNQVIKDGVIRDQRSLELGGVLCFEMEAAGLMNNFPCLVVRGICDYADSHKNKSWQPYASAAAAACAKEILSLVPKTDVREHSTAGSRTIFTVPFARDASFVGREETLTEIQSRLGSHHPINHRRTALVGLGGVGKSQVAIEFTYRFQERHPQSSVFWIHASNANRFEQGYQNIAIEAKLPRRDDQKTNVLRDVHSWLSNEANGQWLMVIDNVDDNNMFFTEGSDEAPSLAGYVPQKPHGSILITSRNATTALNMLGTFGNTIEVEALSDQDSLKLLETRIPLWGQRNDAQMLVDWLERVPIALVHAAAYIKSQKGFTISQYLQLFLESEVNQVGLLSNNQIGKDHRRDFSHQNTVMITWQITFDQIRQETPAATDLLALMSMFDRQGISGYLLDDSRERLQFREAIATLLGFSLIHEQVQRGCFEMHRLVRLSMRKWLKERNEYQEWLSKALSRMERTFPSGDFTTWSKCQELLPHSKILLQEKATVDGLSNFVQISVRTCEYLLQRGEYDLAEQIILKALDHGENTLESDDQDMLQIKYQLASTYWSQGRYKEAEELHERVLRLSKRVLGREHVDTIASMGSLALLFREQGDFKKAKKLGKEMVELKKRLLGAEHPSTLTSMHNLAIVYADERRFNKAAELHAELLEIDKRVLRGEHPHTLTSMNCLAVCLNKQGRPVEAEALYAHVLEVQKRVLGRDHPDTLTSEHNLACCFGDQGRLTEACNLMQECMISKNRVSGPYHPHTSSSSEWLKLWQREKERASTRVSRE